MIGGVKHMCLYGGTMRNEDWRGIHKAVIQKTVTKVAELEKALGDESAEALSVGISAAFSWRQHDGHRLSFSEGGTGDVFRAQPATVATAYPSLPSWRGDMVDAAILRVLKQAPGRRVALATLYPAVVVRGGVRVCRL